MVSPTTAGKLPGWPVTYARFPHVDAEPEAATPDRVEQENHAGEEPHGDRALVGRRLHREGDEPAEREDAAEAHDDARPAEAKGPEEKWQEHGEDCDQVAGHAGSIGC